MARGIFSSGNYLSRTDICGLTDYPVTMACWFQRFDTSGNEPLMILCATSGNEIIYMDTLATRYIRAYSRDGATYDEATTSSQWSTSTWTHAAAVFTSASSRTAYINGSAGTANTTTVNWPTMTRTALGVGNTLDYTWLNGHIAEAAIWSTAVSGSDISALANGTKKPTEVTGLVAYWPVCGDASPEPDEQASYDLTITGTVSQQTHPEDPATDYCGAASSSIPIFQHYYRMRRG